MPTLPTITVTQAQMDRLLATFGDATTYKVWLKQQLKNAVIQHEISVIQKDAQTAVEAKRAEVSADLDNTQ